VGISRQHVHNLLNVTHLPRPMQDDIRVGELTEKHGRALLRLRRHPAQQSALWERIHGEALSGDAALDMARALRSSATASPVTRTSSTLEKAISRLCAVLDAAEADHIAEMHGPLRELSRRLEVLFAPRR
jgi:ParB-like chromosome segregation protein Spo0J